MNRSIFIMAITSWCCQSLCQFWWRQQTLLRFHAISSIRLNEPLSLTLESGNTIPKPERGSKRQDKLKPHSNRWILWFISLCCSPHKIRNGRIRISNWEYPYTLWQRQGYQHSSLSVNNTYSRRITYAVVFMLLCGLNKHQGLNIESCLCFGENASMSSPAWSLDNWTWLCWNNKKKINK